ncbi:MAG TPA: hypothetical protein VNP72_03950 [Longimicrobium sp.]|nr:hypothetical protein [Longimicrobium sp.]
MILPATLAPNAAQIGCALDRHFGPFERLAELKGWLGADWVRCSRCRSVLTAATAGSRRIAA